MRNFGCLDYWPVSPYWHFWLVSKKCNLHCKQQLAWFAVYSMNFNPLITTFATRPSRAVGNVSEYRCVSDCRSRGRKFDPDPVPYSGVS